MTDKDDDLFPEASFEDAEPETVEQPEEVDAPEPVQEAPAELEPEKTVPLAALQAARDEAKTLKAKLADFDRLQQQVAHLSQHIQQPRITPDDPDFLPRLAQAFDGRVTGQKMEMSRFLAERDFGKDVVAEAYAYFDEHPQESQALLNEVSPFHAAVDHYKRMKAAQEIGSDPDGYRARIEAEIRQKILAEQAAESVKQPSRGPSLASQPNLGSRQGAEWSGPTPLDDILRG